MQTTSGKQPDELVLGNTQESRAANPPSFPGSQAEKNIISTVKGGSILMMGRLFTVASRLVIAFVLARLLQAEQYGLYNLAITAATMAGGFAVFGLDTTVTRYIALMNSRKDTRRLWGVIQVALGTTLFLSLLISTGLFALAYPIADRIFNDLRLAPLLQLSSLVVPFLALSDVLAGATRGFKNMRDTVIAQNVVQPLVRLGLIVILALVGLNVGLAIIVFGIADMSASVILLIFLNKRFELRRSLVSAQRDTREILGFSFTLGLSDMLVKFRSSIQTLLLGSLYTVTGVGIFSIVNQVTLIGNIFHTSMNHSSRPLIAELHDQGKRSQLNHLYMTSTRWIVTLNLPLALIIMLFPSQLLSLFGKSFMEGAPALVIMALVSLVNVATGMCGAILEMTGHSRIKLINTVIKVSLAIVANVLLIPRYGIVGAALAALIHEIVSNLLPLIQLWIMYRLLPYNRNFLKPLLAGFSAAGIGFAMRLWLPENGSIIEISAQILVVLAVYGAVILLLGLADEERTVMVRLHRRAKLMLARH